MNPDQEATHALYQRAANGDPQAFAFLDEWNKYSHAIDDFIDQDLRDPSRFLEILAQANLLYSMPFYVRHAFALHCIVAQVTNHYAVSIKWAQGQEDWQRQWADRLRFAGNEMVGVVAYITGGWALQQEIWPALQELAWRVHHDPEGKPV